MARSALPSDPRIGRIVAAIIGVVLFGIAWVLGRPVAVSQQQEEAVEV
jgi:hypothetical protein